MQSSEESGKVSGGMEPSFPTLFYLRLKPSPMLSVPSHSLLCSWPWPVFLLSLVSQGTSSSGPVRSDSSMHTWHTD